MKLLKIKINQVDMINEVNEINKVQKIVTGFVDSVKWSVAIEIAYKTPMYW